MAAIPSAAGRLEELIAMNFLVEVEGEPTSSWLLWLDLWAQSVRLPEVASVRQKFDERWRETIIELVAGRPGSRRVRPGGRRTTSRVTLSALLDGLAIQVALEDPSVSAGRAFELGMRFAAGQLGFEWTGRPPGS